ncbi:arginine utilization regulatory protein [Caloranaerobacter azorensis DSM 13643]|uniref:Arginine utilization regulatory protein n=1 Tax=Caloranaerobacter azorensis DSM 13643 TaxID=1121264 RepID=A0A1M5STN4_9FIRM|nr:sigma 54-interacting transcriptional regulator [Caloranaerobacter azorensis]SHH41598.1 arginine utilization regulatory protein [Caloranaerobacter azorensis DSM 13643]
MRKFFFGENIFEILDYLDEGIHIIDDRGNIVYYNRAAQRLDEIEGDKAIGRHILEIYPSLTYETSTLLKVIKTGQPIFNVEQTFVNYKGDRITTLNTSLPIKANGKIIGALEISKDITQVRRLSEKILDLQKELFNDNNKKPNKSKHTAKYTFVDIIGQSEEMLRLKSLALKASMVSSPVLIYGKTGTGKELFVQSIHNASPRKNKPFIAQNCAALPSGLLESILFGTVKGSFTGAEDRPGLFELANGGTLFLDEINSMPLDLQAKLLRVIQDGSIRRVGAVKTIDVDVRIIAAINVSPDEAIEKKQIRRDLYYRLNVITLGLPELKKRPEDIPLLVEYFIDKYNKVLGRSVKRVSKDVMDLFLNYHWPGNVRELEHVIEGIMTLNDIEEIQSKHLPIQFKNTKSKSTATRHLTESITIRPLREAVEETERNIIYEALKKTDWNITKTSELIRIPRQTLQYKMKKYKLKR